jgi:anaerobic C4-dicarboxylate transporter
MPAADGGERIEQLELAPAIMMTMLAAAGLNMLVFKAQAKKTLASPVMSAGIVALISIAGLAWLGSSFFDGNREAIVQGISGVVSGAPWLFAVGLFALSILLSSQAATVTTLAPVAVALGLSGPALIAMFPATAGYFFLPTYGTLVAAVSFDRTGTTKIGKYVLNHSFMLPGLVAVISAVAIGFLLARFVAG